MRFNIAALILASGLTSTVATPPPVLMDRNHNLLDQNKAIIDGNQLPPNCNLGSCLKLGGEISCITSAIASGDPTALQKCFSNSISQVCSCAACIPLLANIMAAIGVCPSKATVPPL